jgi:plastocyanin
MLSGRYLFVFVVMIWGMNAVPANAATIQVTIDKLVFSPVEVKAKVGDTITWINKDIVAHTATVRGGSSIRSMAVTFSASRSRTVSQAPSQSLKPRAR